MWTSEIHALWHSTTTASDNVRSSISSHLKNLNIEDYCVGHNSDFGMQWCSWKERILLQLEDWPWLTAEEHIILQTRRAVFWGDEGAGNRRSLIFVAPFVSSLLLFSKSISMLLKEKYEAVVSEARFDLEQYLGSKLSDQSFLQSPADLDPLQLIGVELAQADGRHALIAARDLPLQELSSGPFRLNLNQEPSLNEQTYRCVGVQLEARLLDYGIDSDRLVPCTVRSEGLLSVSGLHLALGELARLLWYISRSINIKPEHDS